MTESLPGSQIAKYSMQKDIRDKLQDHLLLISYEESDVVYIFSLIRKLTELDEGNTERKILKLFCNWALHTRIEDTSSIKDFLIQFREGDTQLSEIFRMFLSELKNFLDEQSFENNIFNSVETEMNFLKNVAEIYRDVPLEVKEGRKTLFKVSITDPDIGFEDIGGTQARSFGGIFKIESYS